MIGSNTILAEIGSEKISFVTYNVFHYLITKDSRFNKSAFNGFYTLMSRSTLISGTGEKVRNKFFKELRDKVQSLKK